VFWLGRDAPDTAGIASPFLPVLAAVSPYPTPLQAEVAVRLFHSVCFVHSSVVSIVIAGSERAGHSYDCGLQRAGRPHGAAACPVPALAGQLQADASLLHIAVPPFPIREVL